MTGNLLVRDRLPATRNIYRTKSMISVVIPALNEEAAIAGTIAAIPINTLNTMGYTVQVLIVDNGSTDRTAELAKKAGADVIFENRRGYGRAYKTGFLYSKGDIIATADADMSYPVEDIPKMVNLLEKEDLDFITTNRYAYGIDGAMRALHKVGNSILNTTTKLLFRTVIRDSQSGMWIFRRELLDRIELYSDGMAFSQEFKIEACCNAKCRWKEVPIYYRKRIGEEKIRSWQDGFGNLCHLVNKRIAQIRTTEKS